MEETINYDGKTASISTTNTYDEDEGILRKKGSVQRINKTISISQKVQFNDEVFSAKIKRRTSSFLDLFKSTDNHEPWPNYGRYVFCLLAMSFNLENSYILPLNMLENGGLSYLFCVIVLTFLYGIPMMFLEIFIGQFSGKGVTECWSFAPILKGIGLSMICFNFIFLTYHLFISGRLLYYMAKSLGNGMPWYYCMNIFNGNLCKDAEDYDKSNLNLQSSLDQYWYMHVNHIQMVNGTISTFDDSDSSMRILSFSVVVIVVFIMAYISWNLSSPIVYALVVYPIICYVILICLGVSLPGKIKSIFPFLFPNFSYLISAKTWLSAMEFVIQSLNLGFGTLLTMSSHNRLKSNIPLAILTVVIACILAYLLQSVLSLQMFRYIMNKHSLVFKDMICYDGLNLIFLGITEMLGQFEWANFWTFLYFSALLLSSLARVFASIELICCAFFDSYFAFFSNRGLQFLVYVILLALQYSVAFVYITVNGYYLYLLISTHVMGFNTVALCMLECVSICYIYSFKNLSLDYKIISGKRLSSLWKIVFLILLPILSILFLILKLWYGDYAYFYYVFQKINIDRKTNRLGYIISGTILSPILLYAIFYFRTINICKAKTIKDRWLSGFRPNIMWKPTVNKHIANDTRYSDAAWRPDTNDTIILVDDK